jgi:hypothetical protein
LKFTKVGTTPAAACAVCFGYCNRCLQMLCLLWQVAQESMICTMIYLHAGVQLPPTDYAHLTSALESAGAAAQLVTTPVFIEKALQLYEMILVRHGLMIVGYSYSAKTSIYK